MQHRMLSRAAGLAVVIMAGTFALSCEGFAASFTADFAARMGTNSVTGKVNVKDKKVRQDLTVGGAKQTIIVRGDKGVTWLLNSAKNEYMEVPGASTGMPDENELKKLAARKDLGTERVNGYSCKKSLYTPHQEPGTTITFWVSERLKWPVKALIKHKQNTTSMEYKNIKETKLSDSLFDLPKGYKKVAAPKPGSGAPAPPKK